MLIIVKNRRKKIYIINHQILVIVFLLRLGSGDVTVILNTSILVTESHYWSTLMREIWTTWVISNLHKSLTKCLMTSLCTASSCFKSLLVFLYFTSLRIHTNGLCTPKHGLRTYSKCQFCRLLLLNPSQHLSLCPPADAAAGLGGAVGLPLSCCHRGCSSDAAARCPQPQQHHCHADCIHHPVLR